MKSLAEFLKLVPTERRRLLAALALLIAVRWRLSTQPYARVRAWVERHLESAGADGERSVAPAPGERARRTATAVRRAARLVPVATCLTQALATEVLAARDGVRVDVRFGVRRKDDGHFAAHAWVEHDAHVVIGDLPDLDRYARLPSPHGAS